jgi:RNA polymerase sigma-70 factor (ECF subfamily)
MLYGLLSRMNPSPVIELNRAVAVAMAMGPEFGLAIIDRPEVSGKLENYRWLHSTRAELLRRLDRYAEAKEAYQKALKLSQNAADRSLLKKRLAEVEAVSRQD